MRVRRLCFFWRPLLALALSDARNVYKNVFGIIMCMLDNAQRQAAKKFVEFWTFQRGSEKGEDQQFWNSLLRDVLGIADVEQHIKYQVPVQLKK